MRVPRIRISPRPEPKKPKHNPGGYNMTRNEFYEKIEEWITQDKSRWNHLTLMAYFYHKYKKRTGVNFMPASWKSNPALTKESRDFSKLFKLWAPEGYANLSASDKQAAKHRVNQKIYNYVNWMFDYKFRYGNKTVTGTGIFLNNNMLNEFEVMYNLQMKRHQDKQGIQTLIKWAKDNTPDVLNSHQLERIDDLGMIQKYIEMYELDASAPEQQLIDKAKELRII
jgi:hypothetical protein